MSNNPLPVVSPLPFPFRGPPVILTAGIRSGYVLTGSTADQPDTITRLEPSFPTAVLHRSPSRLDSRCHEPDK